MGALRLISRFFNTTTIMKGPSMVITAALLISKGVPGTHAIFHLRGSEGADSVSTTEAFDSNVLSPPAASRNIRRDDQTPDPAPPSPDEFGNVLSGVHVDEVNASSIVSGGPISSAAAVPVAVVPPVSSPPSRREVPAVAPAPISIGNATSAVTTISPAVVSKAQAHVNSTSSQLIEQTSPGPRKVGKLDAHHTKEQPLDGRSVGVNRAREPYQPNTWFGPEESSGSVYGYRGQHHPQNVPFFGGMRRQIGWSNYMSFNSRPLKVSRAQRIEL